MLVVLVSHKKVTVIWFNWHSCFLYILWYIFPPSRWLINTLHLTAAAPPPLSTFSTYCVPHQSRTNSNLQWLIIASEYQWWYNNTVMAGRTAFHFNNCVSIWQTPPQSSPSQLCSQPIDPATSATSLLPAVSAHVLCTQQCYPSNSHQSNEYISK